MNRFPLIPCAVALCGGVIAAKAEKPNIVLILADDLGYGDLGCYGQSKIKTPELDKLADSGMRFTQAYSAASVCSPSRASLLTGFSQGHAPIRANREVPGGQMPLPEGTHTVARALKSAGYATACFGKWGLGPSGSSGDPSAMGFDRFFGYKDQAHAHDYYPKYLDDDAGRKTLDGKTYSAELIGEKTVSWLKQQKPGKPFFLFAATTLPHLKLQVPSVTRYAKEPWKEPQKKYAAMVSYLDAYVGKIRDTLKSQGLDKNTVIVFTSDNGPDSANGVSEFFDSAGGLRGVKRGMYEGSLRMPFIVNWPGHIPAGKTEKTPVALYDLFATFADIAGAKAPEKTDGLSLAPLWTRGEAPSARPLYFELHEPDFRHAVRLGDWKLLRPNAKSGYELYNLAEDAKEAKNLAEANPAKVAELKALIPSLRSDGGGQWKAKAGPKSES